MGKEDEMFQDDGQNIQLVIPPSFQQQGEETARSSLHCKGEKIVFNNSCIN
jgi:hypothetical protein